MVNFGNDLIETAISLVFIILLFSIFHSAIMELIQLVLRSHNYFLLSAIENVLNDRANFNFSERLFNSPVIRSTKPRTKTLPAYISSDLIVDGRISVLYDLFLFRHQIGQ